MSDDDNVYRFDSVQGGKTDKTEDTGIPVNNYRIVDIDNEEWFATGFLIFTPHHLAIMRDEGSGAVPVIVMPIDRVKAAGLYVEDDEEDVDQAKLF